jgi:5-methylthioadenosine/S-adenosylhomocysteine deaminase
MTNVDLLVTNASILTMDNKKRIIKDGAIAVTGDSIVDIGRSATLEARYHPRKTVNATGMAAVPGLINTHLHVGYTLLKGVASDITERLSWLCAVYPHVEIAGPDDVYHAAMLGCLEMIKGGTTLFIENNPFIADPANTDAIAQAVNDSGIRVGLGRMFSDINAPAFLLSDSKFMKAEIKRLYATWHGKASGRIQLWIYAPGPGMRESPRRMAEIVRLARDYGIRITSHWAEGGETGQSNFYTKRFGTRTPTEFLLKEGYLGHNTLLVHVVAVDEKEIDIISRSGTSVSHNPTSNTIISRRPLPISPVAAMLKKGITVGLGTDASICNDRTSMWEAMKHAVLLQKLKEGDARAMVAEQGLELATRHGAAVAGMEGQLGSLEKGKKADIMLVGTRKAHIQPIHNIYENLVYCAHDSDVDTLIVNGRVIMQGRKVKTFDEEKLIDKTLAIAEALDRKAARRAPATARLWQEAYKRRFGK